LPFDLAEAMPDRTRSRINCLSNWAIVEKMPKNEPTVWGAGVDTLIQADELGAMWPELSGQFAAQFTNPPNFGCIPISTCNPK